MGTTVLRQTLFAMVVAAVATGCAAQAGSPHHDSEDLLSILPADGKADGNGPLSEAKRAVLLRIRARRPEMARLKAELAVGETHDGYVAEPTEASTNMDDLDYAVKAGELIAAENADRDDFYDLVMAEHEADIRSQIDEQLEDLRAQVVEQLCAQLPRGVPCEEIAETTIGVALDAAMDEAIRVELEEVRSVVLSVYAEVWQDRLTEPGQWIETEVEPGVYAWRLK